MRVARFEPSVDRTTRYDQTIIVPTPTSDRRAELQLMIWEREAERERRAGKGIQLVNCF